jgi:porphobilinogen synthase
MLRKLRINSDTRDLVREIELNIEDLIYNLFIVEGEILKNEIASLPYISFIIRYARRNKRN